MDSDQGKLFIGGISWETDEEKLKEYFQGYGEVLQTVVMRDKLTGKPRGFGFVVFADPNILDSVLQDTHVIDNRTVEAKRALSRDEQQTSKAGIFSASRNFGSESSRTKKIFVGGLPSNIDEEGFRHYFEAYGTVTDVAIIYDQQTDRPRGFGFISFDSEDAVDSVLHKTFHDLNGKQVEVKRALPKDASPGGSGRSMGGGTGGRGSYQGYGPPAGNSNSYDGRMDSNRYIQSQNAGGGYPPYGPSGYSASGYGYGPVTNGMGYGGYGNYGGGNSVYGGPSGSGYGNPNAGYGGAPVNASRSSWGSQAPSGYGNVNHESSQWGSGGLGRGGIATGQSPSGASGYGNQGYGYGGYGGNDRAYGNYGAIGGHPGSGPNGNASAGEGQAGAGSYDAGGNLGYENSGWQSEPVQGSGNFGQQSNGPNDSQVGYGGGYGSAPARPGQQQ